jgi:hypothetical protein
MLGGSRRPAPWAVVGVVVTVLAVGAIVAVGATFGARSSDSALIFVAIAQAVAAVVLVAITAWYAWATRLMARVMEEQTEALVAPVVEVRVERQDGDVALVVENTGRSAARQLRLSLDHELPTKSADGYYQPLGTTRLFSRPLAYLGAGVKHRIVLGVEGWLASEGFNYYARAFTVEIAYYWRGEPVIDNVTLETHALFGEHELVQLGAEYRR